MSDTHDGIILGGGHNALILQAYLCQAGLDVLLLERNHVVGGGLSTLEDPRHPGFHHNTHAFFQRAITSMPWYRDLALERHGAHYLQPELNVALLTKDGRALEWWTDFAKTVRSFATFSRKDADTLRRWHEEFVPIVRDIVAPEAFSPPLPPEERRTLLARTAGGRRLLEVSQASLLGYGRTMPWPSLVDRLKERTRGRLLLSDSKHKAPSDSDLRNLRPGERAAFATASRITDLFIDIVL